MLPLKVPEKDRPNLVVSHKQHLKTWERPSFMEELLRHKQEKAMKNAQQHQMLAALGLMLSLLLVTGIFEWRFNDGTNMVDIQSASTQMDQLLDIPITNQPPPPPKTVLQMPNIVEVSEEEIIEDIEINLDLDITENTTMEEVVVQNMDEPEEEVADEIFLIVEEAPHPVGGLQEFMNYLASNIEYPASAKRMNISGRVFVQFVVNADGALSDFVVVKGIGAGCDEEAVRVLSEAPKWIPGKQRGRNVRVRMVVPVNFILRQR